MLHVLSKRSLDHASRSPTSLQRDWGLGKAGVWEEDFWVSSSPVTGAWEELSSSVTLKCSEDRTGSLLQERVQVPALSAQAGCPLASSLTSLSSSVLFRKNGMLLLPASEGLAHRSTSQKGVIL